MNSVGWALIGASFIAEDYVARMIKTAPGATLHGVFSRSAARRAEFAARFDLPKTYTHTVPRPEQTGTS
jgi:predicted dehydrogenase